MSNGLLTHKQMFEVYRLLKESGFEYPYTYNLQLHEKILYFVGAKHSNYSTDRQFNTIKELWQDFLKKTNSERIALVEGNVPPLAKDEVQAIIEYGEPGFVTYLAASKCVKIFSPEPSENLEVDTLLKKYKKEEIAVYHFVSMVSQWQRLNIKENLDDYTNRYIRHYFSGKIWADFDFSPTNLKLLYKKILGREFNKNDDKFMHEFVTPSDTNISGASSDIRDMFILEQIKELWKENNLFIVYGSGHAIRLENALREFSTNK